MELPYSQACENNKRPILAVLERVFAARAHVLEIGSGTGQHAVFFAEHLKHATWQPSDQQQYFPGLNLRCQSEKLENLREPVELDIRQEHWPSGFDAVFSANTAHIMAWDVTQLMLEQVAQRLPVEGVFALYGPFNYAGEYTSDSNRNFDQWLKSVNPQQGIRDFEAINALAKHNELHLVEDNAMPANNRLLVWQRAGKEQQA